MTYSVKEIYYTVQGEGAHSGRPAVFCRFAACNLWSGREEDRSTAVCRFCDTDFLGTDGENGDRFRTAAGLADSIAATWPGNVGESVAPYVVCTGGEPLLQLDEELLDELHARGLVVAVETNGTKPAPRDIDWICVSPKGDAELVLHAGDELKLVYPQPQASPECFEQLAFDYFFLQPMDGPDLEENTRRCLDYCRTHPKWRLSLQTHKMLGIP